MKLNPYEVNDKAKEKNLILDGYEGGTFFSIWKGSKIEEHIFYGTLEDCHKFIEEYKG